MILLKLCHKICVRLLVALVIISTLVIPPAFCLESEDSQIFITGFNAYQQKDYATSIASMSEVLHKYPNTPLRDVTMFWLARAHFKAGNLQDAARYLSQFSKEYPDNPLTGTVEEELAVLTARYEKGEKLPVKAAQKPVDTRKAEADQERTAAARAEEAQLAAVTAAEEAHVAAIRQAEEKTAREKRAQEQAVASAAENQRVAREAAARQQKELELERVRIAAAAAEKESLAQEAAKREKAEQQRVVAAKEAEARITAETAEQRRLAAERAERERKAAAKAEGERQAAAAESARLAADKAEAERKASEAMAARQKAADETTRAAKAAFREKAITQYKTIIDKYPASKAAVVAAAKLRELGVVIAVPAQVVEAPLPENAQVLRIEVAQFAGFEFNLLPHQAVSAVARQIAVPFEVINRGNGRDSFLLTSAFPAAFSVSFTSAAAPTESITRTPELAPGDIFKGSVNLTIPAASIDGLRISYPIKVTSRLLAEASQSREIRLIASAPLLRAVVRTENTRPVPGGKMVYRVAILNVGSAAAQDITFRLGYPPQLRPVDFAAAGFKHEETPVLTVSGLRLKSGENREFSATFQLADDAFAGQELLTRAELIDNQLKAASSFVSNSASVDPLRGIAVRAGSEHLTVIPGQVIAVPFVITNKGNMRESFKISAIFDGAGEATVYNDLNRDGIRQSGEPKISAIGPLAPREEASVIVEVSSSRNATDRSTGTISITTTSEGNAATSASGATQLTYSRPVLKMEMSGRDGRLKPGDIASFDLVIANNGSNLARVVELQSAWPEQLEIIAAEPSASAVTGGDIVWRFKEVGAGEKRSIKVSFRVKPGIGVGTAIQVKNILTYEDQQGNRY